MGMTSCGVSGPSAGSRLRSSRRAGPRPRHPVRHRREAMRVRRSWRFPVPRHEHSTNVECIQATAQPEHPMPRCPAELLVRRFPPVAVAVRLVIDAGGALRRVDSLDVTRTPEQARLFDAVRQACLRWKFTPLMRCDLDAGPATAVEDTGMTTTTCEGHPTALPFHLDHACDFSRRDGRPRIDAVNGSPPR